MPASSVVLAMGPWTGLARQWLPGIPPIVGQLGHSIVLQADHQLSSHCFFVDDASKDGVQRCLRVHMNAKKCGGWLGRPGMRHHPAVELEHAGMIPRHAVCSQRRLHL